LGEDLRDEGDGDDDEEEEIVEPEKPVEVKKEVVEDWAGTFPRMEPVDMSMTKEKSERIKSSMAKLSLKRPVWADKVPEDVWLTKMFS